MGRGKLVHSGLFLTTTWLEVISAMSVELKDSPACSFPAIYNFGDSNSDTGGISAAFVPISGPYGEGFFHKPAGRDSDGRLIIDFIGINSSSCFAYFQATTNSVQYDAAERLNLPYLSAYLNSLGTNYRHGANFATGGSTIRRQNETIFEYGISPFSLDIQIVQFDQFKARATQLYQQGEPIQSHNSANFNNVCQSVYSCCEYLDCRGHPFVSMERGRLPVPEEFSKALYTFDIGQNDLSVGFRKLSTDQLRAAVPDIVNQLASAVQNLYQRGGRAFWIHNTGPIGCLPVNLFYKHNLPPGYLDQYGCLKDQNDMAIEFNKQLKDRVIKLRTELPEAAITYVDVYAAKYGLISNAKTEGFTDPLKICCGYHANDTHIWCGTKGSANGKEVYGASCENPSVYVSWDGVHYAEAANHWVANHIFNGSLSDPPIPITQACYRH